MRKRIILLLAVVSAGAGLAALENDTLAADASGLTVRGELGAGSMLSAAQRDALGYGFGFSTSLRPGFRLNELISVEGTLSSWFFPADAGTGRATLFGAGLRLDPRLTASTSLFVDVHGGVGLTGPDNRPMIDVGTGVEFRIPFNLTMGPFLRYGNLFKKGSDAGDSAKFWALGVALAFSPAPARAAPPIAAAKPAAKPAKRADRDGDGVIDDRDKCPEQAQGASPDPARPGCPTGDSDGDGVADRGDECAALAAGPTPDPNHPGCPDGDDDKDHLVNSADACPREPPGLNPDRARAGCPMSDRDGDSVADLYDTCPDKVGGPSAIPSKNGCPGLVQISNGVIRIMKPVFFATNRAKILPKSFGVLGAVAGALQSLPDIHKVAITGHTDGRGNPEKNLMLSQQRADSVREWLVGHGVEVERVESQGMGDTQPIASNKTSNGRATNRRVEFVIVDPPQPNTAQP